jgi:putative FmdB family regulatory protein
MTNREQRAMPLYEYQCEKCSAQVELLVQGSQQPKCPQCGSDKLSKLLSVVAAPTRDGPGGAPGGSTPMSKPGGGSCGTGCGCHPHG